MADNFLNKMASVRLCLGSLRNRWEDRQKEDRDDWFYGDQQDGVSDVRIS